MHFKLMHLIQKIGRAVKAFFEVGYVYPNR